VRINPQPLFHIAAGGGPVLFRSAGDGEVGFGLHLEVEPTFDGSTYADPRTPGAQRGLYGLEVQGVPYVTSAFGLTFALALGLAQYGNLEQTHFAFGGTLQIGVVLGSLRHDR